MDYHLWAEAFKHFTSEISSSRSARLRSKTASSLMRTGALVSQAIANLSNSATYPWIRGNQKVSL